ncbi:uncharacterized protein HMPREF1541_04686 [Cyphellophora europaea CBS 101466]|uniref:SUN domain-containing protein n=1 Tax=Cyphellophora europaea (strain CBS 101466) TaxID=1220924 RepID=W2RXM1_CYPE1|nr:uncharacterized protein HMPREF1541_04686 [Cyphellophora europaea CBS 101466]ETN40409.1 hypothetical protein HMPREF1541_04686 [Cyphellophora europaea CBS 101466]
MVNARGISLLYGLITTASASVISATQSHTAPTTVVASATCPSRTANVITHNLPQQCLTSTWKSTESILANVTGLDSALPTLASLVANTTDSESHNNTAPAESLEAAQSTGEFVGSPTATPVVDSPSHLAAEDPRSESDEASPLDDGKFMSFEDWKRQNLQKSGQSEHVGRDHPPERLAQRKRPANMHTALDTLGDDAEIELDFTGFIPDAPELISPSRDGTGSDLPQLSAELAASSPPKIKSGNKDAGTTCKERFNYASFDCAANVLKHNPEATSASAVLGENKDAYMLNVCSADNKFLILELCDDISIDTIVLANYEFFSSIFRTFRVSVSDKYPVKVDKWKSLGTFEARNTREVQAFLIENPVMWARYIRIELLSHYGNEYYCPVSLVRVHGTTMLEEYKHDLESAQAENEDESGAVNPSVSPEDALVPEAIAEPLIQKVLEHRALVQPPESISLEAEPSKDTGEVAAGSSLTRELSAEQKVTDNYGSEASNEPSTSSSSTPLTSASSYEHNTTHHVSDRTPSHHSNHTTLNSTVTEPSSIAEKATIPEANAATTASNATPNGTQVGSSSSEKAPGSSTNATASDRQKSPGTPTQSQPAAPTMQESFFKSVQKRLQMLESNSSLSLQYIEDQSRALRDAFKKVEQRQLAKTETFLDHLNSTVLSELREFRQQYDQLWQSTVIELEMQRERYHHETEAMNTRLGILADELILQKRISILQMVLVLICLALVLFTKGAFNQYLELPLVQSVLARSPSSRWLNTTSLDTPTASPPATRQSSIRKRHGILKGHRRGPSEDSIEYSPSANEMYSPPTPVSMSYGEPSDGEQAREQCAAVDDPEFDPSTIERPSTSPPELPSTAPSTPELRGVTDHESIESRLLNATSDRSQSPGLPRVIVEEATPPPKILSWNLPGEP